MGRSGPVWTRSVCHARPRRRVHSRHHGALGLNEASLYNHFKNKADLLAAAFEQLEERLIAPGFAAAPPDFFKGKEPMDLSEFLIAGSTRFFGAADRTVLLTWRILMMSQYAYPAARDSVRKHLLEAPSRFFVSVLEALKNAGWLGAGVDCESYGRIIAAVYFDYSFRSNLDAAWDDEDGEAWDHLCADLRPHHGRRRHNAPRVLRLKWCPYVLRNDIVLFVPRFRWRSVFDRR